MRSFDREQGFPYDQYVWVYSRCYGLAMRALHAVGLHRHQPSGPFGEVRWCHWCGDRRRASA